jgi:hypothetical protein
VGLVCGEADWPVFYARPRADIWLTVTSLESEEADALPMPPLNSDSILDRSLLSDESLPVAPREADEELL